jgi:hypothetical protein
VEDGIVVVGGFHFGSDGFVVKVEGEDGRACSCSAVGQGEGGATGGVAALVAERLYALPPDPGVFHIEQLFDPSEVFARVAEHGIEAGLQGPPPPPRPWR